jgi:hypothetical protein
MCRYIYGDICQTKFLSEAFSMTMAPREGQALLRKESFSTYCDGLDHPEGLAGDHSSYKRGYVE